MRSIPRVYSVRRRIFGLGAIGLLGVVLTAGSRVVAQQGNGSSSNTQPFIISGQAHRAAWSGWWWPDGASNIPTNNAHLYDTAGESTPLQKYGQWTGDDRPLRWEGYYHGQTDPSHPGQPKPAWVGHCDGWAISSLRYSEPRYQVMAGRIQSGGPQYYVVFNPGDIKGLLATVWSGYVWAQPAAGGNKTWGDLRVSDFHKFLLYYLRDRGQGLVVNLSSSLEQVWNYPCDRFQMKCVPESADPSHTDVTVTLSVAEDFVPSPNAATGARADETYTYSIAGDPQEIARVGQGEWTGDSKTRHPLWVFVPSYPPQGYDPERVHDYATSSYRALVEGLAKVSAGEADQWQVGDYVMRVTP